MIDSKKTKHNLRRLQKVKTWQLVVLFVLMLFVSATFLRLNSIGMIQRRDAVLSQDKAGDAQAIQNRLYDLQRFVSDHMNTDMQKGIYLQYSYERDVQKVYNEASKSSNPNGNIYKTVQDICAPQFTHWSLSYIQCTTNELAKYPEASDLASSVNLPKADTYLHSFAAPIWSPDFAGFSVLICAALLLIIVVRLAAIILLKWLIHRHKGI